MFTYIVVLSVSSPIALQIDQWKMVTKTLSLSLQELRTEVSVDRSQGGRTYPEFLAPDENFVVPDSFLAVLDMDEGTLVRFALTLFITFVHHRRSSPMVSTWAWRLPA